MYAIRSYYAFLPILTIPTATSRANAGDPSVMFEPRIAADMKVGKGIFLVANIGYRARKATQVGDLMVDDEILVNIGAEVPIKKRISVIGEIRNNFV